MISLITNDSDNDLFLDANKNIAISKNRLEAIRQLVQNKLQTFIGEINTNLDEGVDYFGIVLADNIPLTTKLNEIIQNILEVPGVIGISNSNYSLDKSSGIANFDITIQTDAGEVALSDLQLIV